MCSSTRTDPILNERVFTFLPLLVVVVVAWHYQPPFPEIGQTGAPAVEPERLLRLLREDETRLVLRTVNESSTLWLHGLFA